MRQHGLLWLLAIIFVFLFGPLWVKADGYQKILNYEASEAANWYGDRELSKVIETTQSLYELAMIDSGIDPAIREHFIKPVPTDTTITPNVQMSPELTNYANNFLGYWGRALSGVYLFFWRLSQFWMWAIYLAPFMVAVIFDGYLTRKAKIESFKYTSPTIYNLSWHLIIALVAFSMVFISLAVKVDIYFFPTVLSFIGLLIRLVIGNVQHSA